MNSSAGSGRLLAVRQFWEYAARAFSDIDAAIQDDARNPRYVAEWHLMQGVFPDDPAARDMAGEMVAAMNESPPATGSGVPEGELSRVWCKYTCPDGEMERGRLISAAFNELSNRPDGFVTRVENVRDELCGILRQAYQAWQDGPMPRCIADLYGDLVETDVVARSNKALEAIERLRDICGGVDGYPIAAEVTPATKTGTPATHSADYRSVDWFGTAYEFTSQQAACVKVLWEAWENRTPALGDAAVLESADSDAERLGLVFRNHPAWGTMIVAGSTKGTHRLAEPPTA